MVTYSKEVANICAEALNKHETQQQQKEEKPKLNCYQPGADPDVLECCFTCQNKKCFDEQAKKIVRMSAPFPPLPVALRSELDVLKITRVWKFAEESSLITQ